MSATGGLESLTERQHAFSEREAGKYLGISAATLRLWRTKGTGPRHFKAGEKLIRYRRVDLDRWIQERLIQTQP